MPHCEVMLTSYTYTILASYNYILLMIMLRDVAMKALVKEQYQLQKHFMPFCAVVIPVRQYVDLGLLWRIGTIAVECSVQYQQ